MLLRKKNKQ